MALKIRVEVIPNSKEAKVEEKSEGVLRVKVDAPAREGKANKRLIEILSKYFLKPKSSIKIIKGLTSKNKEIEID
jgi:hypothetical protein